MRPEPFSSSHPGTRALVIAVAALTVTVLGATPGASSTSGRSGPQDTTPEVSSGSPSGSPRISEDGLVAAYDMSTLTLTGRLRDFGPHGLHGAVAGSLTIEAPAGRARVFRTVDDRVDLPEDPAFDIDGPLTIAARMRVDRGGLHQHVAACDDKWALWVTPDDRIRLGDTRGGGWSAPAGSANVGSWQSVVIVLDATAGDAITADSAGIWIDGVRVEAPPHLRTEAADSAGAWRPGELYPDDACYLGFESHQGDPAHQSLPFVGALDELLIFSRAWTAEEVRAFAE